MSSREERRYLAFLEAPPLEATRAFILDIIEQGYPQLVALSGGEGDRLVRRHPQAEADLCP